ncbi:MAG: hypothetical protein RJB66_802 [Pseudomonadota bacterium]|jgi:lipoyl(octanoyl) transferase
MQCQWLGLQLYEPTYKIQIDSIKWPEEKELILGLEHNTVVTLGRRAKLEDEMLHQSKEFFFVQTDRGGLATLHSPGQLIIYPLLSLSKRNWGPKDYVCQLLQITKTCLQEYGVRAQSDESQSGLFVDNNKICFIGLRVAEGRVYHGLALNVSNDLSLFGHIRSCGIPQRPSTSLRCLDVLVSPKEVFERWCQIADPRFDGCDRGDKNYRAGAKLCL